MHQVYRKLSNLLSEIKGDNAHFKSRLRYLRFFSNKNFWQCFTEAASEFNNLMSNTVIKESLLGTDADYSEVLPQHSGVSSLTAASLQNLVELMAEDFDVSITVVSLEKEEDIAVWKKPGLSYGPKHTKRLTLHSLIDCADGMTVFENINGESSILSKSLAQNNPGICFYAAVPLLTKDHERLGVLCLADYYQRKFSRQDRQRLKHYANCVVNELELRASVEQEKKKLLQKESQLEQAFKMANIGGWEHDIETGKTTWSDELFALYRPDKKRIQNTLLSSCSALVQRCHLSKTRAQPDDVIHSTTEQMTRSDGTLVFLNQQCKCLYNAEGKPIKIIGVWQDVTAQLMYENKLKESEERFRALVQNSSDMTAVLDEQGNIKYISPTSFAISGYNPDELIGRNVFDFMHEADMDELVAELQNVANSTNSGEPTLHRFRTKSGAWIWLESKGMNMMANSHVGGIIINARDVTERIYLEERLSIEEHDRQRAITSAVIKAQEGERSQLGRELHDNVNQVLTTVKLYTEMICDGIGDQKELVKKAGHHLQDCIDEIRSISKRLSAPTLGEISLEDSIKELIESINLTNRIEIVYAGQGITGLQIPQELHLAIYRIIQEQLNNIIKYAGASQVCITLKRKETVLNLYITDNGKGFDLTAKRTGIGITNMRTRAENQNGVFRLESEPGKGCRLQVQFPLLFA